jgi:hypothetical protein
VLFQARFWPSIVDGSVTVTFRRWRRRQVVAGHRYRTGHRIVGRQMIEVDRVDVVDPAGISNADARRSGYRDAATLVGDLRGDEGLPVYRIEFHRVDEPDPRSVLAATAELAPADRAEIDRRLDRLDRASTHGPWTRAVLATIGARPATRAADLAADFGRDTAPFKVDVRKLKNLGLTESLEIGYRLSPRGAAYLVGDSGRESADPGTRDPQSR